VNFDMDMDMGLFGYGSVWFNLEDGIYGFHLHPGLGYFSSAIYGHFAHFFSFSRYIDWIHTLSRLIPPNLSLFICRVYSQSTKVPGAFYASRRLDQTNTIRTHYVPNLPR
jgi:hypothetical protein